MNIILFYLFRANLAKTAGSKRKLDVIYDDDQSDVKDDIIPPPPPKQHKVQKTGKENLPPNIVQYLKENDCLDIEELKKRIKAKPVLNTDNKNNKNPPKPQPVSPPQPQPVSPPKPQQVSPPKAPTVPPAKQTVVKKKYEFKLQDHMINANRSNHNDHNHNNHNNRKKQDTDPKSV